MSQSDLQEASEPTEKYRSYPVLADLVMRLGKVSRR
jgi:hypothetical protein